MAVVLLRPPDPQQTLPSHAAAPISSRQVLKVKIEVQEQPQGVSKPISHLILLAELDGPPSSWQNVLHQAAEATFRKLLELSGRPQMPTS